jgi:hypothetical protein
MRADELCIDHHRITYVVVSYAYSCAIWPTRDGLLRPRPHAVFDDWENCVRAQSAVAGGPLPSKLDPACAELNLQLEYVAFLLAISREHSICRTALLPFPRPIPKLRDRP